MQVIFIKMLSWYRNETEINNYRRKSSSGYFTEYYPQERYGYQISKICGKTRFYNISEILKPIKW